MATPKKHKLLGKMLQVSAFKMAVFKGQSPRQLSDKKTKKIKQQVSKMLSEIDTAKRYQPFTSNASRRKARQVGA